ncbi:iripin-2-like [Brevipalpus obovatus]|uniref:iripin-2-like n=1 Tax=Brevipalpus obovatus TaxID=246614 RepID=UPI003D9DF5BE
MQIIDRYSSHRMRWKLEMANLALISKEYKLRDEYRSNVETFLKAKIVNEDFASNSTLIVDYVNQFVAFNTDRLIDKALDGPVDPTTKLLIINTVAFNGEWARRFAKSMIISRNFFDSTNTSSKIQFMTQTTRTNYGEIPEKDMSILELEYLGDASMYIFLPNRVDGMDALIRNLTIDEINSYIQNRLTTDDVDVEIPKFEFKAQYDLVGQLRLLGLSTLFTSGANFSGITEPNGIRLTGAIHKAMIKVSEKGTKAAAFTGFEFHPLSIMFGQKQFIADHPFLFFIRDKSNGINIFSGAVHRLTSLTTNEGSKI